MEPLGVRAILVDCPLRRMRQEREYEYRVNRSGYLVQVVQLKVTVQIGRLDLNSEFPSQFEASKSEVALEIVQKREKG